MDRTSNLVYLSLQEQEQEQQPQIDLRKWNESHDLSQPCHRSTSVRHLPWRIQLRDPSILKAATASFQGLTRGVLLLQVGLSCLEFAPYFMDLFWVLNGNWQSFRCLKMVSNFWEQSNWMIRGQNVEPAASRFPTHDLLLPGIIAWLFLSACSSVLTNKVLNTFTMKENSRHLCLCTKISFASKKTLFKTFQLSVDFQKVTRPIISRPVSKQNLRIDRIVGALGETALKRRKKIGNKPTTKNEENRRTKTSNFKPRLKNKTSHDFCAFGENEPQNLQKWLPWLCLGHWDSPFPFRSLGLPFSFSTSGLLFLKKTSLKSSKVTTFALVYPLKPMSQVTSLL